MVDQISSSELLNCISEIKIVFEITLHSLVLFENDLKSPSEGAAKPFKQLFDAGQCAYHKRFTTGTIENFLVRLFTYIFS